MNNLKRKPPYHKGVRSKTERKQCTSAISLCKKGAPQGSPGHSSHGSQIHHLLHQKNRKSYMVEDVKHHTIKRRFAPNSNTSTQMLILKYKYTNKNSCVVSKLSYLTNVCDMQTGQLFINILMLGPR